MESRFCPMINNKCKGKDCMWILEDENKIYCSVPVIAHLLDGMDDRLHDIYEIMPGDAPDELSVIIKSGIVGVENL